MGSLKKNGTYSSEFVIYLERELESKSEASFVLTAEAKATERE
jgi:hypothetical protein